MMHGIILIHVICLFLIGATATFAGDLASRVVILVNKNAPESMELGLFYAERRGIPAENIARIPMTAAETISWEEFIEQIHNPLQLWLFENEWFEGRSTRLMDDEGRYRSIVDSHRISYLVVCRGVPLRINNDPGRITDRHRAEVRKQFLTNAGAVDSELSMLALTGYPLVGIALNPIFEEASPDPALQRRIIKVSRLDGPTFASARNLVESALSGEKHGLRGRAYIDLVGPHATGNEWLLETADQIRRLGFSMAVHDTHGVFPPATRFDAPVLYFGWYASDATGPFLNEEFRFSPGAIALHIHSFSARTMHSESAGWTGPFVSRGVAVTMGNVNEPYLELTHRPHLFFRRLAAGATVGEAAYYSLPALSWQAILIGDPLYRPFAVSLEEQLAHLNGVTGDPEAAYVYWRKMMLLAADRKYREALEVGVDGMERHPSLAMAYALARQQIEARQQSAAMRTLAKVQRPARIEPRDALLAKAVADLFSELNEHSQAIELYERILGQPGISSGTRALLLEDGVLLAARTGRRSLERNWRDELSSIRATPASP